LDSLERLAREYHVEASHVRVLSGNPDDAGESMEWQRAMRWRIAVLLCVKLALLTLLWTLFFSPSHRIAVDSVATSDRFGVSDGRSGRPSNQIPSEIPTQPEKPRD
jgi:hypothetical protein